MVENKFYIWRELDSQRKSNLIRGTVEKIESCGEALLFGDVLHKKAQMDRGVLVFILFGYVGLREDKLLRAIKFALTKKKRSIENNLIFYLNKKKLGKKYMKNLYLSSLPNEVTSPPSLCERRCSQSILPASTSFPQILAHLPHQVFASFSHQIGPTLSH